jgi:hypothetical protein
MAHEQAPLTVGEFSRWSERTDKTLDRIDGKLDNHGDRITALETKIDGREKSTKKAASGWSAGVAAAIIAVLELLHRFGFIAHAAAEKAAK